MKVPSFLLACVALSLTASGQTEVQTLLGDVKDTRTTGKFFAGLEIELKLLGDVVDDAKTMRTIVSKCVDDTGRDLVDTEKMDQDFETISNRGGQNRTITVRLKNPARKAVTVKELSGEVEMFVPKNDPEATIKVESFQKQVGNTITSPTLKGAGVEVTPWNKDQYEAMREKRKEEAKKAAGNALAAGMAQAFGDMFNAFTSVGPNDVILHTKDPNKKIVAIEFQDANGKPFESNGRMSMGGDEAKTSMYHFQSKLPETAQLVIYVATPKASVKSPISLTNIVLP